MRPQLAGDLRPGQITVEQYQHVELPVAERLDGRLRGPLTQLRGQGRLDRFVDAEQASRLVAAEAIRLEVAQQAQHRSTFVQEQPEVAV